MRTSARGRKLIQDFEAYRQHAYPDPASRLYRATPGRPWGMLPAAQVMTHLTPEQRALPGAPWTCGFGATDGVTPDTVMTRPEAEAAFIQHLRKYETAVDGYCEVEPNQNQFDAMVSLCYNVGVAGFLKSTVLKAHNRGDHDAAARAFGLWNKAGGRVMQGLTRRRAAEAALYLEPAAGAAPVELPPQQVDAERPMRASEINRAGVVAGGTAAVATVAETTRTIADVKYSTMALGDWLVPILLVVVVALCGYVVWERVKQRRGGWA